MNKRILILIVSVLATIILLVAGILFYQKYQTDKKARLETELIEKEKEDITKKSEEFASVWGTYDYKTYPDKYVAGLKPYLTSSFYLELTDQKKDMGFAKSIDYIKKQEQVSTARPIRVLTVEKVRNEYVVRILVEDSMTDKTRSAKKESTIRITWSKESGQYRVSNAKYEFIKKSN